MTIGRSQSEIIIRAFNPYERRFPSRKLVTREVLDLSKRLRAAGVQVRIDPEDSRKLEFITRKGALDLLQDPFVLEAVGVAKNVLISVFSAWLYERAKNLRNRVPPQEAAIAIEARENGQVSRYALDGGDLSDEQFARILATLQRHREAHDRVGQLKAPDPAFPLPLFLEHTFQQVGWARAWEDETGLATEARVFDPATRQRMEAGELTGFSITGIVKHSTCGVCGKDYVDCLHVGGETYDGVACVVHLHEIDLCELHVVGEPINPLARLAGGGGVRET